MTASHAVAAARSGPGDVVARFLDVLPPSVRSHRDFSGLLRYLGACDPDVASFCHYLEWNLRTGAVDPTFSFPTLFAGQVRIRLHALCASLGADAGVLACALRHLDATPIGSPDFARAVSVSVESLADSQRPPGIDFVFLDFGPPLDLASDPEALARAFAFFEPADPPAPRADSLALLARMSAGFGLAHVGVGRRRGAAVHKVYLRGQLEALIEAAQQRRAASFFGTHAKPVSALAAAAGGRVAHCVVDAAGGRLARIGFELNFDVAGAEGFPALATRSALWTEAVSREDRAAVEALALGGPFVRELSDGTHASLRTSHLKVSFDPQGDVEWKAYLCFQKTLPG